MRIISFLVGFALASFQFIGFAQEPLISLMHLKADPYGCPRPAAKERNVPLNTSFFLQLSLDNAQAGDKIDLNSLSVKLLPEGGKAVAVIMPGRVFARGYKGAISHNAFGPKAALSAWFDSDKTLSPLTSYTLSVSARSERGAELSEEAGSWWFVTEGKPRVHGISYSLNMADGPQVKWLQGGFFSGICSPCVNSGYTESWKMMKAAQDKYPRAWSLQRCGGISGPERQPAMLWEGVNPNISRSQETRRISAMEKNDRGVLLRVEDFFGHEQYGIESSRPVSEDYQAGYEVVITDGIISTRTLVLSADDEAKTILVKSFAPDPSAWKIAYSGALPTEPYRDAPGLFPPGGCYIQRINPVSTPKYYWGRLDAEQDRAYREYGRRLVVNFLNIPGDMAIDGLNGSTKGGIEAFIPADYAQLHESIRTITTHILDRFGDAGYDFYWSIFNEPDLFGPELRSQEGWNSLQVFYDYAVDAILRAFEDKGMDSKRVIIGGIELGAIWGTHLRATEFLAHCSLRAQHEKAVAKNAAYANPKLNGKRSRIVEEMCGAHGGKGSPMNFLSVHAYNNSEITAGKLIKAKQTALELDPEYYKDLIVTTFESAPNWTMAPDPAAYNSLLGNGYFSTWCADVSRRLLGQAQDDSRFARTEGTITRWMFPIGNFKGLNEVVQVLSVDDNGDGKQDRDVSIAMPVFHFLTLLNSMDQNYYLLPERTVEGHQVAGFASRTDKEIRVLLYTHNMLDIESSSGASFDVSLDVAGLNWEKVNLESYQIDKEHNSVYPLAKQVADRFHFPAEKRTGKEAQIRNALIDLEHGDSKKKLQALKKIDDLGPDALSAAAPILFGMGKNEDEAVRTAAGDMLKRIFAKGGTMGSPKFVTGKEAKRAQELSELRPTLQESDLAIKDGRLHINLPLLVNGVQFVVISGE